LPLVLIVGICLALLTAGLGLALSIMFIRFDDTRNIVNVLLMILMYLTPIFYPVSVMNKRCKTSFLESADQLSRNLPLGIFQQRHGHHPVTGSS
jgi:ABC-type polysaccharide/polyol phosphate export permease